jgi:hypothetical protein
VGHVSSLLSRKVLWCTGALLAALLGAFAASRSVAATRNSRIAPALTREFSVFRQSARLHLRRAHSPTNPASIASGYPALQDMLQNMMQSNDPSAQFDLDFAAAVLVQTPAGATVLVPGETGACVLLQVSAPGPQPSATSACNSTANILRTGGLVAEYLSPRLGVSVLYGMSPNNVATASLMTQARTVGTVSIKDNAFAVNTKHLSRVLLRDRSGRSVRTVVIPKVPRNRLHLPDASR